MKEAPGIPVAILAGGLGRRMGGAKPAVRVGGVTLLERVHRAATRVSTEIAVVTKAGDPDPAPGFGRVEESHPERCPLSGVVAALRAFPDRAVLVLACDHPFLEAALLARLAGDLGETDARVPVVAEHPQPLVAVYGPGALGPLSRCLAAGHLSLLRALSSLRVDFVCESEVRGYDPGLRSFVNVNDPEGAAEAERRSDEKN